MTTPTTPFVSLTRTVLPDTSHVLDAIDANGRAADLLERLAEPGTVAAE